MVCPSPLLSLLHPEILYFGTSFVVWGLILCRVYGCYWGVDTCACYFDYYFQVRALIEREQ